MFTTLLRWLAIVWETFLGTAQTIWNWLRVGWMSLVAAVVALFGFVEWLVEFIGDAISGLTASLVGLTMPSNIVTSGSTGDWLATINTFFPLNEAFAYLVFLSGLWVACLGYRFFKSWLPSVS